MDRFIRRENVRHFREMLQVAETETERHRLQTLLDEEIRKQVEAGDFGPGGAAVAEGQPNNQASAGGASEGLKR